MHQDATWYEGIGLGLGEFVFDGKPSEERAHPPPPNFWPTSGWMKTPLGTDVDLGPGYIVLDVVPAAHERGTAAPSFRPMSIVATVAHLSYC